MFADAGNGFDGNRHARAWTAMATRDLPQVIFCGADFLAERFAFGGRSAPNPVS